VLNISVDMANENWHKDELPWMPQLFGKSHVLALARLANSYRDAQPALLSLHSGAGTHAPNIQVTKHKKVPCFTLKI